MGAGDAGDLDAGIGQDLAGPGYAVRAAFLEPRLVRALAGEGLAAWRAGALRPAGTGAGARVRPERRGDSIRWVDPAAASPALAAYLARMETLRLALNRALFLGLFELEAHVALYPPGSFYERHLDRLQGDSSRVVSTVLYLNEAWSPEHGGCLRLWLDAGRHLDVLPAGGTLAAFLSERFEHEVLPATRRRLSLTGWFRARRPTGFRA
jgi:SM-20-related protein